MQKPEVALYDVWVDTEQNLCFYSHDPFTEIDRMTIFYRHTLPLLPTCLLRPLRQGLPHVEGQ